MFELQEAFPELHFSLNGGVTSLELAQQLLKGEWKASDTAEAKDPQIPDTDVTNGSQHSGLYGVMIGRAAMNDPCCLAQADKLIYGE